MRINTWRNDLFDQDCAVADAINEQNLITLLRDNQNTEFGRRYGFAGMRGSADFRRNVPIFTYEDFERDIERMFAGEADVLTAYPVRQFIRTSGTSGQSKRIPRTEAALARYGQHQGPHQPAGDGH